MLVLLMQRDATDKDPEIGNYTVNVKVTKSPTELETIATCRVENFRRRQGWLALIRQVVRQFEEDDAYEMYELLNQLDACSED